MREDHRRLLLVELGQLRIEPVQRVWLDRRALRLVPLARVEPEPLPATGLEGVIDRTGKKRPQSGKRPMRHDQSFDAPAATMRAPSGGATIGERLGLLKGMLRQDSDEAPAPAVEADVPAESTPE